MPFTAASECVNVQTIHIKWIKRSEKLCHHISLAFYSNTLQSLLCSSSLFHILLAPICIWRRVYVSQDNHLMCHENLVYSISRYAWIKLTARLILLLILFYIFCSSLSLFSWRGVISFVFLSALSASEKRWLLLRMPQRFKMSIWFVILYPLSLGFDLLNKLYPTYFIRLPPRMCAIQNPPKFGSVSLICVLHKLIWFGRE